MHSCVAITRLAPGGCKLQIDSKLKPRTCSMEFVLCNYVGYGSIIIVLIFNLKSLTSIGIQWFYSSVNFSCWRKSSTVIDSPQRVQYRQQKKSTQKLEIVIIFKLCKVCLACLTLSRLSAARGMSSPWVSPFVLVEEILCRAIQTLYECNQSAKENGGGNPRPECTCNLKTTSP